MIITKTPFRVSFVGGGSDLKSYYNRRPGAVLSTSINKYMYISSHLFFDANMIRVKYSKTETVDGVDRIEHPIVREVLKKFEIGGALEISSNADIPSGSGLGSSSSFTVGLLHNMYTRMGMHATKERLAKEACEIEIERLGEPIGKQDQYAAAVGGLNVIRFETSGVVIVEPIHLKEETYRELENNLLMFYVGNKRKASSILEAQDKNMQDEGKARIMDSMVDLVWKARDALYDGDLNGFGRLLHENWLLKREMAANISNGEIDELYEGSLGHGAVGGKLLGAGGGGFLLLYCERDRQAELRAWASKLTELKFRFDNEGSKLLYIGDEYD